MYTVHPSKILNEAFRARPYQGVDPSEAKFLFVGLDANYNPEIEQMKGFPSVLAYHHDAVEFWRENGVHHPFLLPTYHGDGRRYHRTFAKIGFTKEQAHLVSFVELLPVPTVGRSGLEPKDLDARHLERLNQAIFCGRAEHIFISAGVLGLMAKSGSFPGLPQKAIAEKGPFKIWYQDSSRTLYQHLHFSCYGKFQEQLDKELDFISTLAKTAS